MDDNLTESQRRLMAVVRKELGIVSQDIIAEIEKLRQEQKARHREGMTPVEIFREELRRHGLGILRLAGMSDKEIADWEKRKARK